MPSQSSIVTCSSISDKRWCNLLFLQSSFNRSGSSKKTESPGSLFNLQSVSVFYKYESYGSDTTAGESQAFAASSDQLDELCIHDSVKVVARYQLNSKQEECSGEVSVGEKLLTQQPELLHQYRYMSQVLPLSVRHKCLSVVGKLVNFSTADMIQ